MTTDQIWLAVGFLGQAFFSARFLIQWIAPERLGKSVVPRAFWYFSIGGGLTLLFYALWRRDPVFAGASFLAAVASLNPRLSADERRAEIERLAAEFDVDPAAHKEAIDRLRPR